MFVKKERNQTDRGSSTPAVVDGTVKAELQVALGNLNAGRNREAQEIVEHIVAAHPDCAVAWQMLGVIAQATGNNERAVSYLERAVEQDGRDPGIHNSLGVVYNDLGRHEDAIESYRCALAIKPDFPDALTNMGNTLAVAGREDDAVDSYRRALTINTRFTNAHFNLGNLYARRREREQAIQCYEKALAIDPRQVAVYRKLGLELNRLGRVDDALSCFERGVERNPQSADLHYMVANLLARRGVLQRALESLRQAIALTPDFVPALTNQGHVLCSQGRIEEGLASFRRAVSVAPQDVNSHSNLLFGLSSSAEFDGGKLFDEHKRWYDKHAARLSENIRPHANDPSPERRLRIGYVSPDFRTHSVGFFFEPLLDAHDREHFEIFCYSDVGTGDATTERLRGSADEWRDTAGTTHEKLSELVREDQIDILVDLTGHTANHRLLVFARKPAPVQVSYLGYPNTTGLQTVDYRLTDERADPTGETDAFYEEELIRLRDGFLCYRPPGESPEVSELPAQRNGFPTFGSFNNPRKYSPSAIQAWSEILTLVPESRLLLKYRGLDDPGTQEYIYRSFEAQGVGNERLELRGYSPSLREHLDIYREVDIALDTFPYNGTTTTCEALWMGVPVITLAGELHAGRVGLSLLSQLGLEEWAAKSREDYVEKAAVLGGDREGLGKHRAHLREQLRDSTLMDAGRFSASVEQAFRQMWKRRCGSAGEGSS